jgi:hypothetical protein
MGNVILFLLLGIASFQNALSANHSKGLHLQLPDKAFDINYADIEELHVFQGGPQTASVMLKLKPVPAERLYKITQKALGKPAVWIWNGRALSVESLSLPIGQDLTVHNFTIFEAEEFKKNTGLR